MQEQMSLHYGTADDVVPGAQEPVIVSASRATDIPAFYADWFFSRLVAGWSSWKNPFSGKDVVISYAKTRFIVFWSKNPFPLLRHLETLQELGIGCYLQYTLNDYAEEGLEPNVPPVEQRIETFCLMAEKLGPGGVVWRNDPLILTGRLGPDELLRKCERIGSALKGYTEKLVFSFADITPRVAANLRRTVGTWREWTEEGMREYAGLLADMNAAWGFQLATCAEPVELAQFGIRHNRCVDGELIIRRAWRDAWLMAYLGAEIRDDSNLLGPLPRPSGSIDLGHGRYALCRDIKTDNGQRKHCGCIRSKDIGEYSTCRHFCAYCYANNGRAAVERNCALHGQRPCAPSITGRAGRAGSAGESPLEDQKTAPLHP